MKTKKIELDSNSPFGKGFVIGVAKATGLTDATEIIRAAAVLAKHNANLIETGLSLIPDDVPELERVMCLATAGFVLGYVVAFYQNGLN
jgi:hypothetical protein